jgi:hypothetical protein
VLLPAPDEVLAVATLGVRSSRKTLPIHTGAWAHTPLVQLLEITTGELLPDQEIPLLKSRRELSRAEALKLWAEKRKAGWVPCSPQW